MKIRNCTKSGKANAEIFSELAWNNFRIRVVVSDLNSEFRKKNSEVNSEYSDNSEFFSEDIQSIRTIPNFFPSSFGQFWIFFRAHSDNSELISELYAEIIWKFIKILFFHENIFFLIRKSPNTPNSIFRANIRNLLLRDFPSLTYAP
jgi:hypothetical protein